MSALHGERHVRYERLLELGRGGMAEVYVARALGAHDFEKIVAIKRILPHLAQDPQFKEMFLTEGRIAAKLLHQNVCGVHQLEELDGELFMVMEYLVGVSWDQLIRSTPRGSALRLTAHVIAQACEGLHYAHTLQDLEGRPTPVIHRDVSPQNLFVTEEGICKVLDFGVSKMMTDGPRTRTGVIKGKLPYMSPEQIRGEPLDGRADVFSLGVCAWEALAGRRLFERDTDFQIWKAVTEEDVPFIRAYWPECPPLVDDVIRRALDRDRARRPATAREFGRLLGEAAGVPSAHANVSYVAETVRSVCGAQIAARREQLGAAVSKLREVSDTIKDGDMRLRSEARRLEREAASTVDALPRANESKQATESKPTPEAKRAEHGKRPIGLIVVVALVAAAVAGGIVAFVMSRDGGKPQTATRIDPDAELEETGAVAGSAGDPWGVKKAGEDIRKGMEDVRKAREDLERLRDQLHGSN